MTFVSRDEWGARAPKPACITGRPLSQVTLAVVHYADAVPPSDPAGAHDEAHDAAAGQVASIQAFHMDTRGWCDIAYHRLIAPDGTVYEGRHLDWVGAHCHEHNAESVGYCFLTDGPVTDDAKRALLDQLAADEKVLARPYASIEGHRHLTSTDCPGDTIDEWVAGGLPAPDATSGGEPAPAQPAGPPSLPCSAVPPGPPPEPRHVLRAGDASLEVGMVQSKLRALGFVPANSFKADGEPDCIFGAGTGEAVARLQEAHGLKVDGIVGAQVWCVIGID